jgi:hypothetical protein
LGLLSFNRHHCQRFASEKLHRCAHSVRRLKERGLHAIAIAAFLMLALSLAFGGLSQKLHQPDDMSRNQPRLIAPGVKIKYGAPGFSAEAK